MGSPGAHRGPTCCAQQCCARGHHRCSREGDSQQQQTRTLCLLFSRAEYFITRGLKYETPAQGPKYWEFQHDTSRGLNQERGPSWHGACTVVQVTGREAGSARVPAALDAAPLTSASPPPLQGDLVPRPSQGPWSAPCVFPFSWGW